MAKQSGTQKYSAWVKRLRLILPASAIVLVLVIIWVAGRQSTTELPLNYSQIDLQADGSVMREPVMRGVNDENRPYKITADLARMDTQDPQLIHMTNVVGMLLPSDGATGAGGNGAGAGAGAQETLTTLTAKSATLHRLNNILTLMNGVTVTQKNSQKNMTATSRIETETLTAHLNSNIIEASTPITLTNATGVLTANTMRLEQEIREAVFSGDVLLIEKKPRTTKTTAAPQKLPPQKLKGTLLKRTNFTTDPQAPFEIMADRLEIFETENRAVFHGSKTGSKPPSKPPQKNANSQPVKATQGTSTLLAHKVAIVVDAETREIKHLYAEKNVVLVSADGRRATGDWAEHDIRADRLVMGGTVTLIEAGENRGAKLRGDRLVVDMKTGKTRLLGKVTQTGTAKRVRGIFTPNANP